MFHLDPALINKKNKKPFLPLFIGHILLLCILPTPTISQNGANKTTVLNTSVCKDYVKFEFSSDSGKSLTLTHNPITLEKKSIKTVRASSGWFSLSKSACHIIQMGSKENILELGTQEAHFVFSVSGTSTDFNKITIVATFDPSSDGDSSSNEKIFNSVQEYLQISSNESGILGYKKDSTFFVVIPKKLGPFNTSFFTSTLSCPATSSISSDVIRLNCLFEGGKPEEYFVNQASYSVGTWMLVGIITFYFVFLLASDDEMNMNNENLRNNVMTLHPVYSIFMAGTPQFTKGSRYCQLTITVSIIYLASTLIFYFGRNDPNFSFIAVLITSVICGLIAAWSVTYITGFLLKRARDVDRDFLNDINKEFSGTELKELREKHERDLYVRYYEYYTICGILVLACVIGKCV